MSASLKPLTLHAHSTGPNPYKIAAALEFLHLPYTVQLWQFGADANGVKGPAFLSLNPNGRVPVLEDPNTGVVSWESGACINYLLRMYDQENRLGPRGEGEQAHVDFDKWVFFLVSTLGPMMGQVNWFRHYHGKENEDALGRYVEQAERCFGVVDGEIKGHSGRFILPGETPSAVDLHFYPWVKQYEFAGLSMERYPHLKEWVEYVAELKEIKAAYEKVAQGKEM